MHLLLPREGMRTLRILHAAVSKKHALGHSLFFFFFRFFEPKLSAVSFGSRSAIVSTTRELVLVRFFCCKAVSWEMIMGLNKLDQ